MNFQIWANIDDFSNFLGKNDDFSLWKLIFQIFSKNYDLKKNIPKKFFFFYDKGGRPFKILHNKIGGIPYSILIGIDFRWLNDVKFDSASDSIIGLKWFDASKW